MKKYKTRQNETLKRDLFPQMFPQGQKGGETNENGENGQKSVEPRLDHNPEPQQPTLDEIWEWLGDPDEY